MKTLTLNIPDALELDDKEASLLLAFKLYEQGKLSLGRAAELAGYTKVTFAEILARHDIPVFNYPASDLARDVQNA